MQIKHTKLVVKNCVKSVREISISDAFMDNIICNYQNFRER